MIAPESAERQVLDTTATSSAVEVVVPIPQTRSSLVKQIADLRDRAEATNRDVADLHRRVNASDLDRRMHFKVREDVPKLLRLLSEDRGMAWNDVAECIGVSGQAIRKWRKGENATGPNRLALAKLAAFLDILSELGIGDPASWLEVPIVAGYPVRGFDLYAAGRADLVLEWANTRVPSGEAILDLFDRDWRRRFPREYETFRAGDRNLSIRHRT